MLNISIAQINPTVGDIEGNVRKIEKAVKNCAKRSHIVVFPELAVSGYTPEDLFLRLDFVRECMEAVQSLAKKTKQLDTVIVVGTPHYEGELYNSLYVIYRGEVLGIYHKGRLPNYSVFDEVRYFREGEEPLLIKVNGYKVGFSICEDIWYPDHIERLTVLSGAEVVININASPYHIGKYTFRESFVKARAEDNICFVVYANLVGGHDELVFDGRSMVIDPLGKVIGRAKAFEEDLLTLSIDVEKVRRRRLLDLRWRTASKEIEPFPVRAEVELTGRPYIEPRIEENPTEEEEIYKALVLGTHDYVIKTGFSKAVLGLSGGMDSSLVACIATDALGAGNVMGVFMPSRFSSQESFEDAKTLADNLGIEFHTVPIDGVYTSYYDELVPVFGELEFDTADENIQARIRANILFYVSNKWGYLVLSTSNKSESATGYTTIYGDMAGGFAPLKDVYKTTIYKLARYRNSLTPVIPERVFVKPPSAELRPGQTDQDTLPPYELLDRVLKLYIEENMSPADIVRAGIEEETVYKVVNMVRKAEYKRKQAPIGIKITPRAFGKDWRMPIVNKYRR
ncbi:NH(3)-dependent NAD(+) synthetase [Hydrogenivirga caldilitoris]|uniref:Glutamine-dependent NAD(+) synthetase n=1 Tax=Hydrogenivirga caldilitoris TaxID=246264 RepID=A0A497XSX2_9AQUI|nr:NAD+ synthase [Hydrogenivirga caldilitoris]RLJ70013.1 NH(3)-dependent NAD(+) synthetase [Hydrogenivirga caldilitoris]